MAGPMPLCAAFSCASPAGLHNCWLGARPLGTRHAAFTFVTVLPHAPAIRTPGCVSHLAGGPPGLRGGGIGHWVRQLIQLTPGGLGRRLGLRSQEKKRRWAGRLRCSAVV